MNITQILLSLEISKLDAAATWLRLNGDPEGAAKLQQRIEQILQ